jgi:hypothetical protein
VTDQALDELTHADAKRVAEWDKRRLEVERSRVAPHIAARMIAPTHSVCNLLREWERMINAMQHEEPIAPSLPGPTYYDDMALEESYRRNAPGVVLRIPNADTSQYSRVPGVSFPYHEGEVMIRGTVRGAEISINGPWIHPN